MANPRNTASVEQLQGLLGDAQTFFLVDYQGLSAGQMNDLRAKVREAGGRMYSSPKTPSSTSYLKQQGIEDFAETLSGPTALILVGEDPVAPAKALTDYADENARDLPAAKGGRLQGNTVTAEALAQIAKLPSRPELQSELVGVLMAPLQQLVGVLQGPQRDLVGVIQNYSDKLKEES